MGIPDQLLAILQKWWMVFAGALLFGAILLLAYCNGEDAGQQKEITKQVEREANVQREINSADAAASETRIEQAIVAAAQEKELTDALQVTDNPDRQRAIRGCVIMRQQGRDTTGIPACR